MSLSEDVRKLVGKRVKSVRLNPFSTDREDNPKSYDPRIEFTDGTILRFSVDETDVGEYGIYPVISFPEGGKK